MHARLPAVLYAWFAIDLLLALAPPLHWALSGSAPVLGVPRVLLYLFGTSAFIAASVVTAYLCDPSMWAADRERR